jgi:hypothetical protein
MTEKGLPIDEARKNAEQQVASLFYTGDQMFVGVAIYFGAIICFLFVLGAFLLQGPYKLWLLLSALFTLSLAWGGNFFLNDMLFDYFPMFNKFRAVSMALGLAQFFCAILAAWGLQELMNNAISKERKLKALYWAAGIVGGLVVLGLVMSSGMSFNGKNDANFGQDLLEIIKKDRVSLLRTDAFRSLFLILAAASLIWAYLQHKLKSTIAITAVALLAIGDVVLVDKRILFDEKFENPAKSASADTPTALDKQIMADKDPHFRVLDLRGGNPFTNALTSYFHKSLGGYHAAKLMRYQDVIEKYLSQPSENLNVISMLNGKYILQDDGKGGVVIPNQQALGNVWFVKNFKAVEKADEELDGLKNLDPKALAIVNIADKDKLANWKADIDTTATVRLTSYSPDKMQYEYQSNTGQFAVFSEIYYPPSKGWSVKIDGKPYNDFFKTNYLLRGLYVPEGKHTLEMEFHPNSFYQGEGISKVFSGLLLVLCTIGIVIHFTKEGLPDVTHMNELTEELKPKKAIPGNKTGKKA